MKSSYKFVQVANKVYTIANTVMTNDKFIQEISY